MVDLDAGFFHTLEVAGLRRHDVREGRGEEILCASAVGCGRRCSIRFHGVSLSSLSRNLDDKRNPSFVLCHPRGGLKVRTRGCRSYALQKRYAVRE